MLRAILVLVAALTLLSSCTQKLVCPAYQSAYIYDKDELRKKFSYFNEDSTPKVLTASKTKYLIAEPTTYKRKVRSLKTVEAKPVMVKVPDSLTIEGEISAEELNLAAQSIIDSTYIVPTAPADSLQVAEDSVYMISIDKEVRVLRYNFPDSLKYDPVTGRYVPEKPTYFVEEVGFNSEQNNYMWYLRDVLVLPDVRLAKAENEKEGKGPAAKGKKERKGIKGFFQGLFKKKKKQSSDTTLIEEEIKTEEDEYNVDFNEVDNPPDSVQAESVTRAQPEPKKKKGLFSKGKKDKPARKTETTPAKKEDDDGF